MGYRLIDLDEGGAKRRAPLGAQLSCDGGRVNAVLTATGYNFSLLLARPAKLLRATSGRSSPRQETKITETAYPFFTDDYDASGWTILRLR
jgi:hypothetical protein